MDMIKPTPRTNGKLSSTSKRCRCTVCGETFSTESNFERHRTGDYAKGRTCVPPETVGLRIVQTTTGTIWKGAPMDSSIRG